MGIFIAPMNSSEAQVIERYLKKKVKHAEDRAKNKADERVNREINEEIDKGVNKIFNSILEGEKEENTGSENTGSSSPGSTTDDSSEAMAKAMMKSFGINSEPANLAESYSFSGHAIMLVKNWDEDGEYEGELEQKILIPESTSAFGMENTSEEVLTTIIIDYNENVMITLMNDEGEKTGFVMSIDSDSLFTAMGDIDEENYTFNPQDLRKTGRTKEISGYTCDEYLYVTEEFELSYWLTDDLSMDLWGSFYKNIPGYKENAQEFPGFPLEMEQKDKTSKARTVTRFTDIHTNSPKTLVTGDYQVMSFGFDPSSFQNSEED